MGRRYQREHDQRAWLAWHIAYLPRSEKPVPLDRLLSRARPREPQTDEEAFEIVKLLNAAYGGTIVT
ncbi:hypothetical protein ASD45_08555 [Pseudolabrys sp. Root1462]|nr:hypothetical protein ASD45_08555 [Pseudolabrys sp. Root1462]